MSDSSYTVHPVDVDKAAVKKLAGDRKVGDSVDGLVVSCLSAKTEASRLTSDLTADSTKLGQTILLELTRHYLDEVKEWH